MSESEIRQVGDKLGGIALRGAAPEGTLGQLVGEAGGTTFWFELDEQKGLASVMYSWTSGYASASYSQKRDLCTGKRAVVVRLSGPDELADAAIYVDGKRVGSLSPHLSGAQVDVPIGSHTLRVEKCGFDPLTVPLNFTRDSAGYLPMELPTPAANSAARCD